MGVIIGADTRATLTAQGDPNLVIYTSGGTDFESGCEFFSHRGRRNVTPYKWPCTVYAPTQYEWGAVIRGYVDQAKDIGRFNYEPAVLTLYTQYVSPQDYFSGECWVERIQVTIGVDDPNQVIATVFGADVWVYRNT